MMDLRVEPVVLEGRTVKLEPLCQDHAQGLFNRGRESDDWQYMPRPCFIDLADVRHWIDEATSFADQLPFAIIEKGRDRAIGSTRYLNVRPQHRSLEIGWSWLGRDWQSTGANTEVKFLMLQHAFERLRALRVEFKTDGRNLRSQRALERIGAIREGVLRQHMIVQADFVRDSVYFSVVAQEWPEVRERLQVLQDR